MTTGGERFTTLVTRFLQQLAVRKPSPHTVAAYRRDLEGIGRRLCLICGHGDDLDALTLGDLQRPALRAAFA